jgi:hypothetical protein
MKKNVSLVIAETGTRWTDNVRAWRSPDNELLVLIQQLEESPREFRDRVSERVRRLRGPSVQLDQILLVVGGCQQEACRIPREDLLHALLANIDGPAEIARVDRIEGSPIFPLEQDALGPRCSLCSGTARSLAVASALAAGLYAEERPRQQEDLS